MNAKRLFSSNTPQQASEASEALTGEQVGNDLQRIPTRKNEIGTEQVPLNVLLYQVLFGSGCLQR